MELVALTKSEQQELEQALIEWAINLEPFVPSKHYDPLAIKKSLIQIRDKGYYKVYSDNFYIYCARRFGLPPDRVSYYINGVNTPTESGKMAKRTPKGLVYFISSGELIKIGYTKDIHKRISCIKTMSPLPLTLLGFIEGNKSTETSIHAKFKNIRSHGEWFFKSTDLESFIKDMCNE